MSIDFTARTDGVYVVTINRPERLNALDVASKLRLGEIWREVEASDDVRAVVVHGSGDRAFCAGSDLKEIRETGKMVGTDDLANAIPGIGFELTKPVVAALHGFTIGMGLTLAIHCDVRIAHPETVFAFPETQHGMLSGISAITLPAIVGEAAALEIMLTGRRLSATEAHRLGLITEISDEPLTAAFATARSLAANSSAAMRITKRLILAERVRRVREHRALVERSRIDVTASAEYHAVVAGSPSTGRMRD
jgi:enoyl-CoA hydratase/carnithine racemase